MKSSLRQVLADSHVSAIAIAVLLLWSLDSAFRGLWEPFSRVLTFVVTAIAIRDIPYFSFTRLDRFLLLAASVYLAYSVITFAAAVFLSRWVYGIGPLRALSECRDRLLRRSHV
jgi:hypothetical protein